MAACQQWQDHPKDPFKKKIRVNKTEKSIIIGIAGECQQMITDQNQWTIRTGDILVVKAHFPTCIFAGVIETPWYAAGNVVPPAVCLALAATLSK